MPLDGPLQVACSVALVGAFLQQKIAASRCHAEKKLALGRVQHALLDLAQFDVQDFLQLLLAQGMKDHDFIQAVHEFGGELAPGRLDGGALYLFVQAGCRFVSRLDEAHAAFHQFADLSAAQVGGEKNNRFRQIHFPIVTKGQSGLIQDAQQQLPQGVAGLLNFIQEQEA